MPEFNGLDLIRAISDEGITIPVILVTGQGDESIAVEAMKLGAADYIVKDDKGHYLELLPGKIHKALARHRERARRRRAEAELARYREQLEQLVDERTRELNEKNRRLQEEILIRNRLEEESRRRQQQLMHADKMQTLGVLVAGVAHEINNPAQFIMSNTPILERSWKSAAPILEKCYEENGDFKLGGLNYSEARELIPTLFEGIRHGTDHIKNIVAELRDYTRERPIDPFESVDMNAVVAASITLLSNMIKKHTRHFEVLYADELPPVRGVFRRLEQVVINLIQNACQALGNQDQRITVATVAVDDPAGVRLEVRDQGRGIAKDDLDHIMDPFFTTKRTEGGTGLGLSISDTIVRDHGGTLTVQSGPGNGTCAVMWLPSVE
jgi:polar amino acid transport system substrate-binding protein